MKKTASITYEIATPVQKVEFWRWFIWITVTLTILIFSVLNNTFVMQTLVGHRDKLAHVIIFLGFFLVTKFLIKTLTLFNSSLITFALGLLIELLQACFTHGQRRFDMYDIVFNLIGIALGLLLLLVYRSVENGKQSNSDT